MSKPMTEKQRAKYIRKVTRVALLVLPEKHLSGIHAALIIRKAQTFARNWAAWATTRDLMPDEDTVEAASALLDVLGVEIKDAP